MSSFAYLRDLPVDYVKIDGRFVSKMAHDPVDEAMVRAMNDIAHALGKQTVAEYVENEAILTKLVDLQVDYLQGYHIGRPVPLTVPKTPRHSNEPLQPRLH
jgi:EAL domain-containing protein (putative c-di-GMP-specific phosphodiesterase class I)